MENRNWCIGCHTYKDVNTFNARSKTNRRPRTKCRPCCSADQKKLRQMKRDEDPELFKLKRREAHKTPRARLTHNNYQKARSFRLRLKVLDHYSNGLMCCACCNETYIQFLALDHINNDGGIERRRLKKYGKKYYEYLLKNNFPEGLQVLCHNCNMAKQFYRICPHKQYD